jgi:hypothetical protein
MSDWREDDVPADGLEAWLAEARPGSFFGIDREIVPLRLSDLGPPARRSLWARIRDAWVGACNGWKWGGNV